MEHLRLKAGMLLAVSLVSLSGLALAAQQQDMSARPNAAPPAHTAAAPAPTGAGAQALGAAGDPSFHSGFRHN